MSQPQQAEGTTEATTTKDEVEYIEYVGYPPYGTEFDDVRQITRREAKQAWDESIPKDLRWTKRPTGKGRGRMLLEASEIPSAVRELLLEDKAFKAVRL